ncbi:unnamed protein product [Rotaria sp. Silwood2]|nr:unnamed protein product [Rotaria sp. Silwood2]
MNPSRYAVSMDVFNPEQYGRPMPSANNVSEGIDILRNISSLLIKQRASVADAILGITMQAKFEISTDANQQILHAFEGSTINKDFY